MPVFLPIAAGLAGLMLLGNPPRKRKHRRRNPRIDVKVTAGSNTWVTGFNGTPEEAKKYFLGQTFNVGTGHGGDRMARVTKVEVLKSNPTTLDVERGITHCRKCGRVEADPSSIAHVEMGERPKKSFCYASQFGSCLLGRKGRAMRNPLKKGKSRATISANIRELMHTGHKQSQAIAIAMRTAGVARKNPKGLIGVDSSGIRWSVKKNAETREWMVVAYVNGKRDEDKTYYTDDKADAIGTFQHLMTTRGGRVTNPKRRKRRRK